MSSFWVYFSAAAGAQFENAGCDYILSKLISQFKSASNVWENVKKTLLKLEFVFNRLVNFWKILIENAKTF